MTRPEAMERRRVAILSADGVGYSQLMAADDVGTVRTLVEHRERIRKRVERHRGRVVDALGDNVLAEFASALDAIQAATEIQFALGEANSQLPLERRMPFRIGLHADSVMTDGQCLYGDGVNIAARLEGLARPGGICISDAVFVEVRKQLDLAVDDLGLRELKGVRSVHAYRVRLDREAAGTEKAQDVTAQRPAIAVLPFENLSLESDQEYFTDGLCEDLITRLSKRRDCCLVIARHSTFVYKGRRVNIQEVGRELGANYVVDGSVRMAGSQVRITAQLVESWSGHHVWAERYDGDREDLFRLQDQITESIVASMYPELLHVESKRAASKTQGSMGAWDLAMRGLWHYDRFTAEDNSRAIELFADAIELDPELLFAIAHRGWALYRGLFEQWIDEETESEAEIQRAAEECLKLDPHDAWGHVLSGLVSMITGRREQAIASMRLGLELNPSLPRAHSLFGQFVALGGRPDEGIASIEQAIRLSPRDPQLYRFYTSLAFAHFVAERYEQAISWAERSLHLRPDFYINYLCIASAYGNLGRAAEAKAAVAKQLSGQPNFSLSYFAKRVIQGATPEALEHFLAGMRKAGVELSDLGGS